MKDSTRIAVGVFRTIESADRAVAGLAEAGFRKDSISVICPENARGCLEDYAHERRAGARTPQAIGAGGAIGGVLGGLIAAAGIAASGGTGLLIVGPLLGGAATGGVIGGFIGAMSTRGLEPEIADYYDQALERGRVLVAVEPDSIGGPPLWEAERVFAEAGTEPIELRKD